MHCALSVVQKDARRWPDAGLTQALSSQWPPQPCELTLHFIHVNTVELVKSATVFLIIVVIVQVAVPYNEQYLPHSTSRCVSVYMSVVINLAVFHLQRICIKTSPVKIKWLWAFPFLDWRGKEGEGIEGLQQQIGKINKDSCWPILWMAIYMKCSRKEVLYFFFTPLE